MKVSELVDKLGKLDPDAEVMFSSCCYPSTKWFELDVYGDAVTLKGYEGSWVNGDPGNNPLGGGS